MNFTALKIGAIGACIIVASAFSAQAQCSPTMSFDSTKKCGTSGTAPVFTYTYSSSQDKWCKSLTAGNAQKDYIYTPANGGSPTWGYSVLFDCTACEGVITSSTDAAKYNAMCP